MAARVNTKFVVILSASLLLVFAAVATIGVLKLRKSTGEIIRLAEQAAAEGDWEKATDLYSRAVFRDQTNPEYLRLWIAAMMQIVPPNPQRYTDLYRDYLGARLALVHADPHNPEVHREYLDEHLQRLQRLGGDLAGWEHLVSITEEMHSRYGADERRSAIIRRFRGLARVGIFATGAELPREIVEEAAQDLRDALELDPADARVAVALSEFYRMQSARLRLQREDQRADAALEIARSTLGTFLVRQPDEPMILLERLRLELTEAFRTAGRGLDFAEAATRRRADLDQFNAAILKSSPARLEPAVVTAAAGMCLPLPDLGADAAVRLLDHGLSGRPDSARLLMSKAETLQSTGQIEQALELLERIANLPDRPLSLDGLALIEMRTRAVMRQVDFVLGTWAADMTATQKQSIIDRATRYRDALAARIGAERIQLDLIDAKIRYAGGDFAAARQLLSRYNEATGSNDSRALTLLGDILQRQGSLGAAREVFQRAVEVRPGDARSRLLLAGVLIALQEYDVATEHLRAAVQLDPANAAANEQLRIVTELQKGAAGTDPVLLALQDVQRLLAGVNPDSQAAVARLRQASDSHGPDIRIARPLAQLLASTGDRTGALAAAREGLAAFPGDEVLVTLERALSADDPLQMALESIDASGESPFRKHLQRANLYLQAGDNDRAMAEVRSARALSPEAPEIIEYDFIEAISRSDVPRARELAELAARRNADNVNGLSFRARVAFVEERYDDAASFLQQALESDPFNAVMWRYLGETRAMQRQYERAGEAFGRAVQIRPSDLPSVKGLARARYLQGHPAEALAAARAAGDLAMRDPEFVELLVTLESVAPGGDRSRAVEVRRQLLTRNPADRRNQAALAELLIAVRQFAEARTILDALRSEEDDASLMELAARWHVAQGQLEAAASVFTGYVQSLPADKQSDGPYILFARLLVSAGQLDAAVQVLDQARAQQDPRVMGADRELADLFYRVGRHDLALPVLQRIAAAGVADEGLLIARGVIDCLNRLGRFQEAEEALQRISSAIAGDSGLMVLQAQAAAGRGDLTRARDLLDRAIAAAPHEVQGYAARAELLAMDPALVQDAEQDLLQVIRIDPRYPGARQRLAVLAANTGNWDKALAQLREAVKESPQDANLRIQFINALVSRDRAVEAVDVLEEAIRMSPEDVGWRLATVEIYQKAGAPDRAIAHVESAWQQRKTPEVAVAYVTALLNARNPNMNLALTILNTPELETEKNINLLLSRARVRLAAGQRNPGQSDILAAFRLVDQSNPEHVAGFFVGTAKLLPNPTERLEMLDALRRNIPFEGWTLLSYAAIRIREPGGSEGLAELIAPLAEQTEDATLATTAMAMLATAHRETRRYAEAEALFRRLLDLNPDDPNFNNNYAYVVGHDLKRPREALPYAEKAARMLPQSANVLHTLGAVYLGVGRHSDAENALARALSAAVAPGEKAPVFMTYARLKLAQDSRADCARYLSMLEELLRTNAPLSAAYGADLREIRTQLEAR